MSNGKLRFATVGGPGPAAPAVAAAAKPGAAAPALGVPRGNSVGGKALYYPEWKPSGSLFTSVLGLLYNAVLYGFIIFLILVFIHFTIYPIFSFSPDDNGFIPIPTASDKQTSYTKAPAASDVSASIVSISPCGYTIGMDVFQVGNFQATTIPRVLLYRSPTQVTMPLTDTSANLITRFPTSNLILWLDPVKNDLYVSAVTQMSGSPSTLETVAAVQNVPVREPFRVTVVFTQEFVEVYINGSLQQSLPFKNPPLTIPPTSYFFPVVQAAASNVMVGNLYYWDRPLSAAETRANGKVVTTDMTFFTGPAK